MKNTFALIFLLVATFANAAKVDTISVKSPSMGKTFNAAVVTPNSYKNGKKSYTVVYLLHGAYGHFNDWLKKTPNLNTVKNLADQYDILIVMPEGETFSFYLDSPSLPTSQFETHIIKEVIPQIDATYRTINTKNGRFITGLSMGGHGALYLSSRHPELFAAAGSMSGAVDTGSMRSAQTADGINKLFEPVFGPTPPSDQQLFDLAIINNLAKLKNNALPLIIDCGTEDFLIEANRQLHQRLLYAKVPHDYTERPGAHTWPYWQEALPHHILFFSKIINAAKK